MENRKITRFEIVENIQAFFRKTNIEKCIIAGLNSWVRGQEYPELERLVPHASSHLKVAHQVQREIGWGHLPQERILLVWATFINFEIQQNQKEGMAKQFMYKTAEALGSKVILIQCIHNVKMG